MAASLAAPDLAEGDPGDQIPEPLAVRGCCATQAEIGVDDLNARLIPAEIAGTLVQRVLQAQALLVGQHLVRRGLADVDHGLAAEMPSRDEVRDHGSPPGERREAADPGSVSPSGRSTPGSSPEADRRVCATWDARRIRSRMAPSESLLDTGGGAGDRLVAPIGSFSRISPWSTTSAWPRAAEPVTDARAKQRPNSGWVGSVTVICSGRAVVRRIGVSRCGLVDAVGVPDERVEQRAHLQQLVPVPAGAGQTRDPEAEPEADMAETTPGPQPLEAGAALGGGGREA